MPNDKDPLQKLIDYEHEQLRPYREAIEKKNRNTPMINNLKTWPEKVWLQVHDEPKELLDYQEALRLADDGYDGGITWSPKSIWSCEVKYIRADLVPELPSVLKIALCIRRAAFPDFRNEEWFDLHSTVRGLLCLQAEAVLALLQDISKMSEEKSYEEVSREEPVAHIDYSKPGSISWIPVEMGLPEGMALFVAPQPQLEQKIIDILEDNKNLDHSNKVLREENEKLRADLVPQLPTIEEVTHVLVTVYMNKKSPAFPFDTMAKAVFALLREKATGDAE